MLLFFRDAEDLSENLLMASESDLPESFMALWGFLSFCPECSSILQRLIGKANVPSSESECYLSFSMHLGRITNGLKVQMLALLFPIFFHHCLKRQPQSTQNLSLYLTFVLMLTGAFLALLIVPTVFQAFSLPRLSSYQDQGHPARRCQEEL